MFIPRSSVSTDHGRVIFKSLLLFKLRESVEETQQVHILKEALVLTSAIEGEISFDYIYETVITGLS